jgi:hypothetical protein
MVALRKFFEGLYVGILCRVFGLHTPIKVNPVLVKYPNERVICQHCLRWLDL